MKLTALRFLLEVLVLDELDDDVFLRLYLQHLQDQAQERGRLDVAGVGAADVAKLHGLVHEQLGYQWREEV